MTANGVIRRVYRFVEALFDAIADPRRGELWMPLVLLGYVAVWTLYATIAKSSQDIHPDMAEMAAWSERLASGARRKHPPLGSWLLRGWFPASFRARTLGLLSVRGASSGGRAVDRLADFPALYVTAGKCVVGISLLTLVPFYNLHALKFNANAVLTPLWAITTRNSVLARLRTRRPGWAMFTRDRGFGGNTRQVLVCASCRRLRITSPDGSTFRRIFPVAGTLHLTRGGNDPADAAYRLGHC